MKVEEKITITTPAGTAPPFGGGWGWNTGDPNRPNDAPDITTDSNVSIQDLKAYNGNDPNGIAGKVGDVVFEYTQIISVKIANMDNTVQDIQLGSFSVIVYKASQTTYTITVGDQ